MQFDLDKLEKDSLEWNRAMIKMLLQLKKDGHKIKEIVNGSGNKVSGIGKRKQRREYGEFGTLVLALTFVVGVYSSCVVAV